MRTNLWTLTLISLLAGPLTAAAQTYAPVVEAPVAPLGAPAALSAAPVLAPGASLTALPELRSAAALTNPAAVSLSPLSPLLGAPSPAVRLSASPAAALLPSAARSAASVPAASLGSLRAADLAPFRGDRLEKASAEDSRTGLDATWAGFLGEAVRSAPSFDFSGLDAKERAPRRAAAGRPSKRTRLASAAPRPAASVGPVEAKAREMVAEGLGRWKTPKPEGEFYSPHSLMNFERDPEDFALHYLFGSKSDAPKSFAFPVGLAVHETLEIVFKEIEKGADPRSLRLEDALKAYDLLWAALIKEQPYVGDHGHTAEDYQRRGQRFLTRRWPTVENFTGKVESLETAMRYPITDPVTGKAYQFVGIPDRVTVDGRTLVIHDWKTHYNPPTLEQLKRDDYQLGIYVLGMMSLFPEKLEGKKIVLSWDYKEFSHEIEATPELIAGIQDRVLRVLHAVETFKRRIDGERSDWEKRANPAKNPAGLEAAKKDVDGVAALDAKIRMKRGQLRVVRAAQREKEAGLKAYAVQKGLKEVSGKTHVLTVETETAPKVPTSSDDEAAHAAVVGVLKEGGVWGDYSTLDYTALKQAAEIGGHPDHAAMAPVLAKIPVSHEHELKVGPAEGDASARGGVKSLSLFREAGPSEENEPGLYSASKIGLYAKDPKAYALQYILGVKPEEAKSYGILTGLAIHETMEALFNALKGGRLGKDIKLDEMIDLYRSIWDERETEADYKMPRGSREKPKDYKKGGEDYIRTKWKQLFPFEDLGEVVYLERRLHFTLKDPATGKSYRFQGIPDRVMIKDGVIEIHDWKTHMVPKSEAELREQDFQLALYTVALRQLYPSLMAGRKVRLIWDFKEAKDVVTIEADDAYVQQAVSKVVGLMSEIAAFTAEVERDAAKWEKLAGQLKLPTGAAEASRWVDELGKLGEQEKAKKKEVDQLEAQRQELADKVIAFQRETGHWRIETKTHAARLRKIPTASVPTKTGKENAAANAEIVRLLKQAGLWEKYSRLDYPALKKALAAETHADKAVLDRVRALLEDSTETKLKVKPLASQD